MQEHDLISFEDALKQANKNGGKVHLLLGNGFSRGFRESIFSYDALLKRTKFNRHGPIIRRIFFNLKTSDFERVIRLLVEMRVVLSGLPKVPATILALLTDLEQTLKSALADTLAANHPEGPFEISGSEYESVLAFLSHFEKIYTLNYDLLLYWSLMHTERHSVDDGFRNPEEPDSDYVTWEPENRYSQGVFYLHGALHIFDSGDEIRKFTWCRTGVRLKDQIMAELNENRYPLIITEGTASSKRERIFHNIYLASAYKSLLSITGSLFIYGAALHEQDGHILYALNQNTKLKHLFVGIYGNPDSPTNSITIAQAERIRGDKKLYYFDAQSAKVWR